MADFLLCFNQNYRGNDLLRLMQRIHLRNPPGGTILDLNWASLALLEDKLWKQNHITSGDSLFGWVGDVVASETDLRKISAYLDAVMAADTKEKQAFDCLNGAFAICMLNPKSACVITDPLGLTQVYAGYDSQQELAAIGTHPDIVAAVSDTSYHVDNVSIAEYLNRGASCFPHTMHKNVRKIFQGSVFTVMNSPDHNLKSKTFTYWSPPVESSDLRPKTYTEELKDIFVQCVKDRCGNGRVAVTLSGGLDSRLILSVIPREVDCLALTFCDQVNREARVAYQVAKAYQRQWLPIYRGKECIAQSIMQCVRFAGCECDWIHGHAASLADDMLSHNISTVMNGYLMDTFLRGYFAKDIVKQKRLGGLIPPVLRKTQLDWPGLCSDFCRRFVNPDLMAQAFARRSSYYETRADKDRGSIVEWLDTYPFSQRPESGTWIIERRILPQRLVAMDRRLLDFSFKCPAVLRANGSVFDAVAFKLFGPGNYIINANTGARPCSRKLRRLFERSLRKIEDTAMGIAGSLGCEKCVQHSWHDYDKYWRTSEMLRTIVQQYRPYLSQFEGLIFNEKVMPIEDPLNLSWRQGFRLLALAIWKANLGEYRQELERSHLRKLDTTILSSEEVKPIIPAGQELMSRTITESNSLEITRQPAGVQSVSNPVK